MHTAGTWWIFQPKSSEKSTENACVNSSPPALSQTLSSTNPGPKKGTDNFLIGEQTSNLDQGMGVFVCGLQPTRIAL